MIAGIGLDIVELERIGKLDAKSPKFRLRMLTEEELEFTNRLPLIGASNFLRVVLREKKHLQKRKEQESERHAISRISDIVPEASGKPVLYFKGDASGGIYFHYTYENSCGSPSNPSCIIVRPSS